MSDRYNGLIVTFEHPIKAEDAELIMQLFLQVKNVIDVQPVVQDVATICVKNQIRHEMKVKLWEILE
jgi:hypothetical protein